MRRLLVIPAVIVAGFLIAVGATAASSPPQIVTCAATTWCFNPNPIRVAAGTAVTWTNGTAAPHTATSDTGAWSTGTIAPGVTSGAITFKTAGTFAYHCAIHPFMTATLIVSAATPAATQAATPTFVSARPTLRPAARLAQSGAGPLVPIAVALVLVGLGLLTPAVWRRRPRGR